MVLYRFFCGSRKPTAGALLLIGLSLLALPAKAQFVLHKFADTSETQPGNSPKLFTAFRTAAAERSLGFYGNKVVTYGEGSGRKGLYSGSATVTLPPLSKVVDTADPFPNDAPNLYGVLQAPDLGGGASTFFAQSSGITTRTAILADFGSGLQTVAGFGTFVPGAGTLTSVTNNPTTDGASVVFRGFFGAAVMGIFRSTGGAISKVVDTNTLVPGGSQAIKVLSAARVAGSKIVFAGEETGNVNSRIYQHDGTALSILVNQGTAAPGGGLFNRFSQSGLSNLDLDITTGNLVFQANTTTGSGVYFRTGGGSLSLIANTATLEPGSVNAFASFSDVTVYGTDVAFLGSGGRSGYSGLFVKLGNSPALSKVLAVGEILEGKQVSEIGSPVLYDDSIAFRVTFSDSTQAVYVGLIPGSAVAAPEPAAIVLLSLGLLVGRRRRTGECSGIL